MINLFSHLLHDGFVDNFDSIQNKLIDFCYQEKEKFTTGYGDSSGLQVSNGENSWHSEKEYHKNNIYIIKIIYYQKQYNYF